MKSLIIILVFAALSASILCYSVTFATPPPISAQVDMKSFSPINLYGHQTQITTDTSPQGVVSTRIYTPSTSSSSSSSWGGGSSGGK